MILTVLAFFQHIFQTKMAQRERTFIMVKPDGVQRGLVGEIIKRFENRGFKLVAMKLMQVKIRALFRGFPRQKYSSSFNVKKN